MQWQKLKKWLEENKLWFNQLEKQKLERLKRLEFWLKGKAKVKLETKESFDWIENQKWKPICLKKKIWVLGWMEKQNYDTLWRARLHGDPKIKGIYWSEQAKNQQTYVSVHMT